MDPNTYESPIIDNLNSMSGDDGDNISPQGVYTVEDWVYNYQAVLDTQYGLYIDTAIGGVVAVMVFIAALASQIDLTP